MNIDPLGTAALAAVSFCRQGVKVAIYDCMQLGDNGVMILPVSRLIEAFYSEATIDCGQLDFSHPMTGEQMHFSIPLPEDMATLCGNYKV